MSRVYAWFDRQPDWLLMVVAAAVFITATAGLVAGTVLAALVAGFIIVLAIGAIEVWYFGTVSEEQDIERERLEGWARRLVARDASRYWLTPGELSMVEHSRIVYDQDLTEDATTPAPVGDASGDHPSRSPGADIPWVDSL